ncbi:hypothetical protein DUI87_25151 [Hirundo rustica rustica]|uniref:Uncharacterized protein n=1 Tax=Hirundo rustica rustica TaxID=333673 RepID=A0A3M0JBI0_HIRRU|nr:hypothetical protein DUI87_25151 [Hirundo rustica rustica]
MPAAVPVENSTNLGMPRENQKNTDNLTWTSSPEEQLDLQQGESFQCCPMATAPAESSGSHGKGLGMSQSHGSSALDYSGGTFESLSEEEESEAPGSWCSTEDLEGAAVSEALESSSSPAGQSPAEEESEAVDPAVERAAIGKWIDAMGKWIDLKNKDTGVRPDKSAIRTPAGIPELSHGELDALRSFCSRRISGMQQEQAQKCRKLQWGVPARQTGTGDSCAVPAQLMNRILLENTREAVKQDMLTLLGEALKSFPKPSEDPRDLWQRLKEMESLN